MKFRSILYIVISLIALILQVVFTKKWGGIGCAIAISGALLLGQGLIMNIYYSRKQGLDIAGFWKEISKMSITPILLVLCFITFFKYVILDSWIKLIVAILIYSVMYILLFWKICMNQYEKNLLQVTLRRLAER